MIFGKSSQYLSFTVDSPLYSNIPLVYGSTHNMYLCYQSRTCCWRDTNRRQNHLVCSDDLCVLMIYELWSSISWLTRRVTLQTSSRCCIFFNISLELSKNFTIFRNTLILFHRLNRNSFYSKTGTLHLNFSINPKNWFFLILMLKTITHWVSP